MELKKRYCTASHEVLAWRFLDLPSPAILTIIDNDHIYRRRSNAWPVNKRLEPAVNRLLWLLAELAIWAAAYYPRCP